MKSNAEVRRFIFSQYQLNPGISNKTWERYRVFVEASGNKSFKQLLFKDWINR